MSADKKWTIAVSVAIFFVVGIVAGVNVVVDANGILRTDYSRQFQPPNMSFSKINFLTTGKHPFDSFIFGSSRENNLQVRHIAGGRYYNMFLAAGLPEEYLAHVRYLLRMGIPVKTVLVGLDEFSGLFDAKDHDAELDLQVHPAVSGKSLVTFYAQHFFKLNRIIPQLKAYLRYNYAQRVPPEQRPFLYDIAGSGNVLCNGCDEEIERDREAHVHAEKFRVPWEYRFREGDHIDATLSVMKDLVDLSRSAGFRLIVFINPLHRATYLNADLKQFARFKKGLAAITDYYDFSGLNSITTNNYYYYETSHFRPMVGDMMLNIMVGSPAVAHPQDFGFLVTRDNIDAHLKDQCREVRGTAGTPDRGRLSLAGEC